jgi:zinc transporter 9
MTYLLLLIPGGVERPMELQKWTGLLLLFSAGTFLFVATSHILPQVFAGDKPGPGGDATSTSSAHLSHFHILLLVLGIFSPVLLSGLH